MLIDKISYAEIISCHEYKEKKRCPICGSIKTKKNGFIHSEILTVRGKIKRKTQRFFCKDCGKSFTHFGSNIRKKSSDELKKRVVEDFIFTKSSLREVGKRYNVSQTTILNWITEISGQTSPISINPLLCSGIIQIDGKEVKVKGEKRTILLSIDANSKQPLTYQISKSENKISTENFLKSLKRLYPIKIKGIISDFGRGKSFVSVVKEIFPKIPHQVCLVHFERYVWLFIPRTKRSKYYLRNKLLKNLIRKVIRATS